ncbi:hypothetical protein PIB30_051710 [Stylosanthes scabra]|uniref:Uncharacterized protein n=1 Tax=Stylosanthes scabra TaxID=79078 RepID=A0ABU6ZGQ3_9FABA|nr:hypothetical protein [Stylosanthes scabra]
MDVRDLIDEGVLVFVPWSNANKDGALVGRFSTSTRRLSKGYRDEVLIKGAIIRQLRSGIKVMSTGTSTNSGGSDVAGSTSSAGSVSATGHNVSGLAVTTAATVSTAVGSTHSAPENEQKQLHDGNRSTAGGNLVNQAIVGGSSGGRGPRPRVEQPPPHRLQSEGWYPFGMPPNFQPQVIPSNLRGTSPSAIQFGSVPNEQPFSEMSKSIASPNVNQPLSTAAVRQLIEESHLDLVNLMTSHLTTILNPIVVDTNAKYEQLAKKFDTLVGFDDNEARDLDIGISGQAHNVVEVDDALDRETGNETSTQGNVRVVQRGENADHVLHQVRGANILVEVVKMGFLNVGVHLPRITWSFCPNLGLLS